MTEILAFILGAIAAGLPPSILLWQKTRECQGLLDELLRKEGRRPLLTARRQKNKGKSEAKLSDEDEDPQLVQTIKASPIDRIIQDAIQKDSSEFNHSTGDKRYETR